MRIEIYRYWSQKALGFYRDENIYFLVNLIFKVPEN
jgi:hypothetical protein